MKKTDRNEGGTEQGKAQQQERELEKVRADVKDLTKVIELERGRTVEKKQTSTDLQASEVPTTKPPPPVANGSNLEEEARKASTPPTKSHPPKEIAGTRILSELLDREAHPGP